MSNIETIYCAKCRCEVFLRADHVSALRESQKLRERLEASDRRLVEESERAARAERALKRAKAAAKKVRR